MAESSEDLSGRVSERCRQLGKNLTEVLRNAGVSSGFLATSPKHGRRYDRLLAIAQELNWTVAELMTEASAVQVDPALLRQALTYAHAILQDARVEGAQREADLIELTTFAYDWLARSRRGGQPISSLAEARAVLESMLASLRSR